MKVINNELLFKYMDREDLNYSDISRKTDISRGTLYNIIWGKNCPSYLVMATIANSLEFTQNEFISIFFPHVNFKEESIGQVEK